MKVLQFEPWLWNDLIDYPDLGVAMLMGAYAQNNIDAKLIPTQLVCVKQLFTEFLSENEDLFNRLTKEEKKEYLHLSKLLDFKKEISTLYKRYYSHSWKEYFDVTLTETVQGIFLEVIKLQFHFLKKNETVPILKILIKCIKENPSDLICISLYECDDRNQLLITALKKQTSTPICIGGAFTGHISKKEIQYLQKKCIADYLSVGPGEINLVSLLSYIEGKSEILPDNIVELKENCDYVLKKHPIRNMDAINEPDYSQACVEAYPSPAIILPVQSARGCTWRKCTFCSHHNGYYGEYHAMSIDKLANEIENLYELYGCRYFVLHDDDIPAKRLLSIGKALQKRNIDVNLFAYVRAENEFLDKDMLVELYKLGIKALSWGMETGSQKLLDGLKKGINIQNAAKMLKLSNEVGISNVCWMMINIPNEEDEDFKKTIDFILSNAHYVDLWLISPFRMQYDSPMYYELYGDEKNIETFSNSVPLDEHQLVIENNKIEKINELFSMGLFDDKTIPIKKLPMTSQRVRLIPLLYRTKLENICDANFQLIPNCSIIILGKTVVFRNKDNKKILNSKEKNIWNNISKFDVVKYGKMTEEEIDFCNLLIKEKWFIAYFVNDIKEIN